MTTRTVYASGRFTIDEVRGARSPLTTTRAAASYVLRENGERVRSWPMLKDAIAHVEREIKHDARGVARGAA